MKRIFAIILGLTFVLTLTGCGLVDSFEISHGTSEPNATEGYFRDIKNWCGAVVGTSYEQATNEVNMTVTATANELSVRASFVDPSVAPYSEAEKLGIAEYQIIDTSGKTVKEGAAETAEIVNGQADINIILDDIGSGNYELIITALVAEKKAEQPLNINGNWECEFTV